MSFATLAAILSSAFTVVVGRRWIRTRKPAFAAWTLGLAIFAGAAACQAIGEASGWNVTLFRGFYLLGGVLGVAYLALGTLFLLARPVVRRVATILLGICTLVLAIDTFTIPVDATSLRTSAGVLGQAISGGSLLHGGAVILNIAGSFVLIGGSGWSAWRFIRDRAGIDRVICNVLLTVGAFVIAGGFSAAKLTGAKLDVLGAYEAVGIAIMFAGFLSIGRLGATQRAVNLTGHRVGAEASTRKPVAP